MEMQVVPLPTLAQLRSFVRQVLCERDRLDVEQALLRQAMIARRGQPCGLFFQLEGPRLCRTYAIWSADECRILFYDSTGARFDEVRLCESPDAAQLCDHSERVAA